MKLFAQIRKVDEEKRLVFGRAAEEAVDKADEIMDYASSKPHFQKWSEEIAKDTGGKNLGNVRAMHGKVAAGGLTAIDFNDADKAVDVCAKIVDDNEWKKVLGGIYTGFSIGGSYVGEKKVEKSDGGKDVTRYTAKPNEISLVDRPCMPNAKFFEVQKADGSLTKIDFQPSPAETEDVTVNGTADEIAELGKLMNAHGLSLADLLEKAVPAFIADKEKAKGKDGAAADEKDADGKPKKKPDAKADAKPADKAEGAADLKKMEQATLRKGMWSCSTFAGVIGSLQALQQEAAYEAYREGDDSGLAQKIAACIAMCGATLKDMIDEELSEITAAVGTPDAIVLELADKCGALAKFDGDPMVALLKIGARNSAADTARLAKIHEMTVELGHTCAPADKAAAGGDLAKADTAALEKLVSDAVAPLQKALGEAQAQLKKLNDQPAAARISLRAISKADDVIPDSMAKAAVAEPVTDALGDVHEAAGLIKSLHSAGGQPLRQAV